MSGEPRASPRAGRERGPRSAAPERRAVAAALAASRPRRHRGAELAGEPLAKGERTRVYTAYRADRWVKWEWCMAPRGAVPRGSLGRGGTPPQVFLLAK